jgi:hypothetical protein
MDVQVNFSSPTIEISHFFFAKNRDIYSWPNIAKKPAISYDRTQ